MYLLLLIGHYVIINYYMLCYLAGKKLDIIIITSLGPSPIEHLSSIIARVTSDDSKFKFFEAQRAKIELRILNSEKMCATPSPHFLGVRYRHF